MNPKLLIKAIRESFTGSISVYKQGSCFITKDKGHIVTKINQKYYDINGEIEGEFLLSSQEDILEYSNRKFNLNDADYLVPEWFVEDNYVKSVTLEYPIESSSKRAIHED